MSFLPGLFGSKKKTTTVQTSAPAATQERYLSAMQKAEQAAAAPYQSFGTKPEDYVASLNAQQNAGISGVNAAVGGYRPYMAAGVNATNTGMGYMGAGMGTAASGLNSMGTGLGTLGQGINTAQSGLSNMDTGSGYINQGVGTAQSGLSNMDTGSGYINQGMGTVGQGTGYINQGMGTVGQGIGSIGEGMDATRAGMGPADLGSLDIQRYLSPYLSQVMGSTADLMNQANMQAQSGALGTAISSGAFGGDRAGIAAANLNQQNQLAMGNTLSNIANQGYQFATTTAEGQQAADLAARQANLARQMQGGAQMGQLGATYGTLGAQQGALGAQLGELGTAMGNLGAQQGTIGAQRGTLGSQIGEMGTAQANIGAQRGTLGSQIGEMGTAQANVGAQQGTLGTQMSGIGRDVLGAGKQLADFGSEKQRLDLEAAQAQINAGTVEQQNRQAGIDAMAKQFMEQKGYPFQQAQYLAEMYASLGPLWGSTTTTTRPTNIFGTPVQTGGRINGYANGGGVAGPVSMGKTPIGETSYIPERILPISEILRHLEEAGTSGGGESAVDTAIKVGNFLKGFAHGGSVDDREGYYAGGLSYPALTTEKLREEQRIRDQLANMGIIDDINKDEMMPANMGLAGHMDTPSISRLPIAAAPTGLVPEPHKTDMETDARGQSVRQYTEGHPVTAADLALMRLAPTTSQRPPARPEGLAPTTSMRPQARPEGLGAADVMTPSMHPPRRPVDLGASVADVVAAPQSPKVDLGTSSIPTTDNNGIARPEQTGIYTGVVGSGSGWVDLTRPDGTVEHRTGARNWRNNNPGNIEYGNIAKQYGAIGSDGRFAVFPDEQSGRNAMKGLLFDSGVYEGMTLKSALNKYSPSSENDTEGKIRAVVAETGLDPNTPLDQMTPQQRDAFTLAIQHTEGPMKGDVGASSHYTASQLDGLSGADMSQQRDFLHTEKPYEDRNIIGKFFHEKDTGKLNTDAILSLLTGIGGAMQAQTMSPLNAILQGVASGADTYKTLRSEAPDRIKKVLENSAEARRMYEVLSSQQPMPPFEDWVKSLSEAGTGALEGATGTAPAKPLYMGMAPIDIYGSGSKVPITIQDESGKEHSVPAGMTYGYLQQREALLTSTAALSYPGAADALEAVRNQMEAIAKNNGFITAPDGSKIADPTFTRIKNASVSQDMKNAVGTELGVNIGDRADALETQSARLDKMAQAFKTIADSGTSFGPGTKAFDQVSKLVQQFGVQFNADTTDAFAAIDVIGKDIAAQIRASGQEDQLSDNARAYVAGSLPDVSMQPAAIAEILAFQRAQLDRERDTIKGIKSVGANPSAAYDADVAGKSAPLDIDKYLPMYQEMLGVAPQAQEGDVATSNGQPIVFRNGQWQFVQGGRYSQ